MSGGVKMKPKSIAFDDESLLALRHIQAWLLINSGKSVSASRVVRDLVLDFKREIDEIDGPSDSQPIGAGGEIKKKE